MIRWPRTIGVATGLLAGFAVLSLIENSRRQAPYSGPILSECDGHLQELVIQYERSAGEIASTTYRDFLQALDTEIVVHALCPNRAAFKDLVKRTGPTRCQLLPMITGHPMTTWARDRWVALAPGGAPGSPTTIWSPLGEAGNDSWPARAGDQKVGVDIAGAVGKSVTARRSRLYFDGGDFLADGDTVFVMPRVLERNIQQTVANREEFLELLQRELKRRVVLLNEAPDHHAGMFMASIGNKVMLVADPSLGKKLLSEESTAPETQFRKVVATLPEGADFSAETQRRFDAVAAQCIASGYEVVRIPVIPSHDGRTFLTYVNVLIDQQPSRRMVYLPWYRDCDRLNSAARAVWEKQGYTVCPVDCSATYRHFGCLHCLVNVLRRSPVSRPST